MSDSSQPHHGSIPPGSHYQPALSVVLIIVVLFVVAAFLMIRYVSPASTSSHHDDVAAVGNHDDTSSPHRREIVGAGAGRQWHHRHEFGPYFLATVTDAGLEHSAGRQRGPHETKTIVYFNPGFKWAAIQIAHKIHVGRSSIRALNGLRPVAGASSDDVIVILGHNSASAG